MYIIYAMCFQKQFVNVSLDMTTSEDVQSLFQKAKKIYCMTYLYDVFFFMCLRWYAEIIWFYHDKNMYYIVSRVISGAEFKYAIRFDLSSKLRDFEQWGHCIKHDYRRPTLSSRCDVINDVINIKIFFLDILWRSFHIWCQN